MRASMSSARMITKYLINFLFFHFILVEQALAVSNETTTTRPPTAMTKGFNITKPGCQSKCGNLTVPYPFGIGERCSMDHWFAINCNASFNPPNGYERLELTICL